LVSSNILDLTKLRRIKTVVLAQSATGQTIMARNYHMIIIASSSSSNSNGQSCYDCFADISNKDIIIIIIFLVTKEKTLFFLSFSLNHV
jgi:hypothetical protein